MKIFLLFLLGILSFSISTAIPMDALLVFIVIYCLTLRGARSFTFSLLTGAVSDFSGPGGTPLAPCYACLGLAQSLSSRYIFRANILYVVLFVLLATFLKSVYLLAFSPLPFQASEIQNALPGFMKEAAGNILVTPIFYVILLKK